MTIETEEAIDQLIERVCRLETAMSYLLDLPNPRIPLGSRETFRYLKYIPYADHFDKIREALEKQDDA